MSDSPSHRGVMVITAFRPKPGFEDTLLAVVREHVPILRGRGLATDRPALAMRAADGTIIEVFEWVSEEAIKQAHTDPEVHTLWARYGEASDCIPYGSLAEAAELYPGLEPIDL